jgi:hypothetical protein
MAEVVENYANAAKILVPKWRDYASGVATKLDSGYDANTASADVGTAVALAIETGALLTWKTLDALNILAAGDKAQFVESEELFTQYKGAKLKLEEDLRAGFGRTLPADRATFIPSQLGLEQQAFKVRVETTGCRAGVYDGKVAASSPDGLAEEVAVRIRVP